ncbi:LlaJI family restriction endonuclease [Veillonella parvula]|uniref:LlaJI family restriction endonuclease n=1 Tax=Veillonella parvula TaxID=29466 RepID=UPI002E79A4EF|nr:LlaJI family restriction endonuclease [Veillonella parvula]
MKIQIIQENKAYTFEGLLYLLNLEDIKLKKAVRVLRELNILKRSTVSNLKELNVVVEETSLISFDNSNEYLYYFKYVGILKVGNICLLVYPKYLSEQTYLSDQESDYCFLKLVLQVIEKYNYRFQNQAQDTNMKSNYVNILGVAFQLLKDYLQNGVYESEQNIVEINGDGELLWNQTISLNDAYIVENVPIYFDWFTLNQENNINNFFHRLHRIILTEISLKFQDIFSLLGINAVILSEENLDSLGEKDYIVNRINQELSIQFRSDRQNILKLLKDYILESNSNHQSDEISFIGTNTFNLVWQDVCSIVKNNCLNRKLSDLNVKYKGLSPKRTYLKSIIDRPEWKSVNSDTVNETETFEPDIISFEENNLAIYDAKYYTTSFDSNGKIKNVPGVESLAKQIIYELAYRDFADENDMIISKNSYLMPTEGATDYVLGSGSIELFKNHTLGNINDITIEMIADRAAFIQYLRS